MKKQKGHLIKTVKPDSIAEEMGIEPGDRLLEINGETVEDIFDYQYINMFKILHKSALFCIFATWKTRKRSTY